MAGVNVATTLVEWKPAGSWVTITSSVLSIEGGAQATSNADNPLAFGDSAEARATITVLDTLTGTWERTPIRFTPSINGSPGVTFVGVVTERSRDGAGKTVFTCVGASAFPQATKGYSPLFVLVPVATKTTATSIDDITSGSYAGGPINWLMWSADGRPYEQAGSYPTASFYYSFDHAVLAPPCSWLAGEDGWQEAQKLVQAAGGQLYQDNRGVVIYRQPFNVVNAAATYTFDEGVYKTIEERTGTGVLATKVVCTYIPRHARPMQQITDDSTPRLINTGETIEISIEPQWPLSSLETDAGGTQLLPSALVVTDLAGTPMAQHPTTGYSHAIAVTAQRIVITLANTAGKPLTEWRVLLRGAPITAGEAGNVTVGVGTVERTLGDNPYIQTKGDATRLANLVLLFYGTSRAQRKIGGCPFDVSRTVGEIVNLTNARLGISAVAHVIVALDHAQTGAVSSYTLAPVSDLPTLASFWVVSAGAQSGTKKLGY